MIACIIYTFAPIVVALNEVGVVKGESLRCLGDENS